MSILFLGSLSVAAASLLLLLFAGVRLVLSRRRVATAPSTDPPRVSWSSPIVVIPVALMALCVGLIVAFFSFWAACVGQC